MGFKASAEDQRIAARVAAARHIAGMSQEQFAEELARVTGEYWARGVIANMETGRKKVEAGWLVAFGEVLDIDPCWFLTGPPRWRG